MDVGFLWVLILLSALVALMTLVVALLWRIARLPKRRRVGSVARGANDHADPKQEARAHNRQFTEFLAEDPSRAEMTKSEQFAAFRQWRQDRGFTWGR